MKELQELINIAKAGKSSARKQLRTKGKIDNEKKAWLKGGVVALDFIIREAELLLHGDRPKAEPSATIAANSMLDGAKPEPPPPLPEFGTKEFNDLCEKFFGGGGG